VWLSRGGPPEGIIQGRKVERRKMEKGRWEMEGEGAHSQFRREYV
jgi:hypothetical protein